MSVIILIPAAIVYLRIEKFLEMFLELMANEIAYKLTEI